MAALPVTGSGSVVVFDTPPASPASTASPDPVQQIINSRWPEKFITTGPSVSGGGVAGASVTGSSAYEFEFPTDIVLDGSSGDAVRVIIRGIADEDGTPGVHIQRRVFLREYTAIDFDKLVDGVAGNADFPGGYSEQAPDALDQKSGNFHNFLWLFRKATAAGGSGEDDSRTITVFKLANVNVLENATSYGDAGDVELTYEQIF